MSSRGAIVEKNKNGSEAESAKKIARSIGATEFLLTTAEGISHWAIGSSRATTTLVVANTYLTLVGISARESARVEEKSQTPSHSNTNASLQSIPEQHHEDFEGSSAPYAELKDHDAENNLPSTPCNWNRACHRIGLGAEAATHIFLCVMLLILQNDDDFGFPNVFGIHVIMQIFTALRNIYNYPDEEPSNDAAEQNVSSASEPRSVQPNL